MLSGKRLVYALVKDGVYDLLSEIDASWITDPIIQKLVGSVAESLAVNGSAKLPDVINTIEGGNFSRAQKDVFISNLKQIVSSPTVWTPALPSQLQADYRDFHRAELAKLLADEMSTVEQQLSKQKDLAYLLSG